MPPHNPLSHHLSMLNKGPNESSQALETTFATASVGIATLSMLENLLPAAASEVERASTEISENFTLLVDYIRNQQTDLPDPVANAISTIIMGMQFQDRNTQIMQNVAAILERYRTMLQEICSNIESSKEGDQYQHQNIANAIDEILSNIRLSDIRMRYMEALTKAKMGSHLSEENGNDDPTGESVELF